MGDFNARIGNSQTTFYDTSEEMLRKLGTGALGLARYSQDEECTGYGRYLLEMGTAHGLAILNGLQNFPASKGFTCFPYRHVASRGDYIMTNPVLYP